MSLRKSRRRGRIKSKGNVIYNSKKQLKLENYLLTSGADSIIQECGGDRCCLSASWLISNILSAYAQRYNISQLKCQFVIVSVFVTNDIGEEVCYRYDSQLIKELRMGRIEQNRKKFSDLSKIVRKNEDIWTIGCLWDPNSDNRDKIYDGTFHSVIVFEHDGSILDLTVDQLIRPKKNLYIKRYWTKRINLPKNIVVFRIEGIPTNLPTIAHSPNLEGVSNKISREIAEILDCKILHISDQRGKVISKEKWDKFKQLDHSEEIRKAKENPEGFELLKSRIFE